MPTGTRTRTRTAVAEPVTTTPVQAEDVVLAEFDRPRGEKISIRKGVGKDGGVYLDLRTMYQDDAGEWNFTRKGVRLSEAEAGELCGLL